MRICRHSESIKLDSLYIMPLFDDDNQNNVYLDKHLAYSPADNNSFYICNIDLKTRKRKYGFMDFEYQNLEPVSIFDMIAKLYKAGYCVMTVYEVHDMDELLYFLKED